MVTCGQGHPMGVGMRFCTVCGSPPLVCAQGHQMALAAGYCTSCGAPPAQTPPSPQPMLQVPPGARQPSVALAGAARRKVGPGMWLAVVAVAAVAAVAVTFVLTRRGNDGTLSTVAAATSVPSTIPGVVPTPTTSPLATTTSTTTTLPPPAALTASCDAGHLTVGYPGNWVADGCGAFAPQGSPESAPISLSTHTGASFPDVVVSVLGPNADAVAIDASGMVAMAALEGEGTDAVYRIVVASNPPISLEAVARRGTGPEVARSVAEAIVLSFQPVVDPAMVIDPLSVGLSTGRIEAPGFQRVNDATAAGDGMVAVGLDGSLAAVWLSPNSGRDWTRAPAQDVFRAASTAQMASIVEFDGRLVAVGNIDDGDGEDFAVWTSDLEGLSWTRMVPDPLGGNEGVGDLVVTPIGLIAVGYVETPVGDVDAVVWHSTDGNVWTASQLAAAGDQFMFSVAWVDGRLVGVGAHQAAADGGLNAPDGEEDAAVWSSFDGVQWQRELAPDLAGPEMERIWDVTAGGPGAVAVGRVKQPGQPADSAVWTWSVTAGWFRVPDPLGVLADPARHDVMDEVVVFDGVITASGRVEESDGSIDQVTWESWDGINWIAAVHEVAGDDFVSSMVMGPHGSMSVGRIATDTSDAAFWYPIYPIEGLAVGAVTTEDGLAGVTLGLPAYRLPDGTLASYLGDDGEYVEASTGYPMNVRKGPGVGTRPGPDGEEFYVYGWIWYEKWGRILPEPLADLLDDFYTEGVAWVGDRLDYLATLAAEFGGDMALLPWDASTANLMQSWTGDSYQSQPFSRLPDSGSIDVRRSRIPGVFDTNVVIDMASVTDFLAGPSVGLEGNEPNPTVEQALWVLRTPVRYAERYTDLQAAWLLHAFVGRPESPALEIALVSDVGVGMDSQAWVEGRLVRIGPQYFDLAFWLDFGFAGAFIHEMMHQVDSVDGTDGFFTCGSPEHNGHTGEPFKALHVFMWWVQQYEEGMAPWADYPAVVTGGVLGFMLTPTSVGLNYDC